MLAQGTRLRSCVKTSTVTASATSSSPSSCRPDRPSPEHRLDHQTLVRAREDPHVVHEPAHRAEPDTQPAPLAPRHVARQPAPLGEAVAQRLVDGADARAMIGGAHAAPGRGEQHLRDLDAASPAVLRRVRGQLGHAHRDPRLIVRAKAELRRVPPRLARRPQAILLRRDLDDAGLARGQDDVRYALGKAAPAAHAVPAATIRTTAQQASSWLLWCWERRVSAITCGVRCMSSLSSKRVEIPSLMSTKRSPEAIGYSQIRTLRTPCPTMPGVVGGAMGSRARARSSTLPMPTNWRRSAENVTSETAAPRVLRIALSMARIIASSGMSACSRT